VGIISNNQAIMSISLNKFGTTTALIMAFGMVVSMIIARILC